MNQKINVLYLINYAGSGGSEKYLKMLADNMKEEVTPTLCYNEEGLLVSEFEERKIKTIKLEMRNPFDLKAAKKLAQIVKENNIEIIHSNYLRENYIAVLAKLFGSKAKIVYTCHFNLYDKFIVALMNRIFYRGLSKIISISNVVTESLIKSGSPKKKIELIYHGVTLESRTAPIKEAKEKFGLTEDDFVISCASRFSNEKGNEFFIKSIKLLKERMADNKGLDFEKKNFKVMLANEGPNFEDCKTLSNILELDDTIIFTGFLKDGMEDLYLASDIYVTPSSNEGLGLATIESLSYGVPNVVTNVGGLTEIINEETNCGMTVIYGDEFSMVDALYKLISDDEFRESLKVNAKKTVAEKFDLKVMMKKTTEVYKKVLEGKK